jgi:LuxR family maltose regulon positive regulatory protein
VTTPNQPAEVFIRTKLTRPALLPGLVERPHLLDRLDETFDQRVMLLSAAAGFGKTTLVAQWVEQRGVPAAWLALDVLDSDPERFIRYLVAAVEGTSARRLPETSATLDASETPPFDYLRELLAAELAAGDEPLVIVLEDYHVVESDAVHRLVERVVSALPSSVHLVVLTRRDPPWPLARWRALGWVTELRSHALRFSLEEAHRFFASDKPVLLSASTVETLQARVEGWIAGLRLLKLSLRDVEHPDERARSFSGDDRLVADYLIGEVVSVQPPEVREFLAVTAALPRFSASLCDHLLAEDGSRPPAHETLAKLEQDNVFLVRLSADGQWYRYHHLFQDLLLHHLRNLAGPNGRAAISRRAAEWFAREGLIEEALCHWIETGEIDTAADFLGANLSAVVEAGPSRKTLLRLLKLFPAGAEHGRLPLLAAHGWLKAWRWDVPGITALLDEADELRRGSAEGAQQGRTDVGAFFEALRSGILFWSGDADGCVQHVSRAFGDVRPGRLRQPRVMAAQFKALGLTLTGRRDEALGLLEDAVSARNLADGRPAGELLLTQGIIHLHAGDIDGADMAARRIMALREGAPVPDCWKAWAHYLFGAAAYERNLLEEADDAFRRVLAARYRVDSRLYQEALVGVCLVALARGDEAAAADHGAETRDWALETGDRLSLRISESLDARLRWATGKIPTFATRPPEGSDFVFPFLEVPTVNCAEGLLRHPSPQVRTGALPLIERALEQATIHYSVRQAIALALLRAEALWQRGEQDGALAEVAAAVRRAEPLGLIRTFVDRGAGLRGLLESLGRREGRDAYLGKLLSASEESGSSVDPSFGGRARSSSAAQSGDTATSAVWPALSNRELDVLELLAERLSNKEIASRLNVSPETVKKHTIKLYEKLQVHGRRQAVAKAVGERPLVRRA